VVKQWSLDNAVSSDDVALAYYLAGRPAGYKPPEPWRVYNFRDLVVVSGVRGSGKSARWEVSWFREKGGA